MCWHGRFFIQSEALERLLCAGFEASLTTKAAFAVGGVFLAAAVAASVTIALRPRSPRLLDLATTAVVLANLAGVAVALVGLFGLAVATFVAAMPLDVLRFLLAPRAADDPKAASATKTVAGVAAVLLAALVLIAI